MAENEEHYSFDILANAIDSIESAMDLLAWDDYADEARKYKQTILHVSHGIELLLKERLRRIHPSLIWENVDKYPSLESRTVGVEQAIIRLKRIGNIEISDADTSLIRSIRNTRNAIEHFKWQTTKSEALSIIGNGLGLCAHFSKEHLGYDFFGYANKKDDTWRLLIERNPTFLKAYTERFERAASKEAHGLIACEFCGATAVELTGGSCTLCGHWNKVERWDALGGDFDDDIPF
ncbi:MAG: hypothetical protein H6978_04400 [Gammaproteobacteria bacterium]|nr:hypothetical protein [Gammaproteobacteria bacterium]